MITITELKKLRASYGGTWPTKEKHQMRWYQCSDYSEYRLLLDRMYKDKKNWCYSCTVERLAPDNIVESFVLRFENSPYWGNNKPWEFAEMQIELFIDKYLKEKQTCIPKNQQMMS